MTSEQEAYELGYFAAVCQWWAWDRSTTEREREELLVRSAKYSDLQLAALTEAYDNELMGVGI